MYHKSYLRIPLWQCNLTQPCFTKFNKPCKKALASIWNNSVKKHRKNQVPKKLRRRASSFIPTTPKHIQVVTCARSRDFPGSFLEMKPEVGVLDLWRNDSPHLNAFESLRSSVRTNSNRGHSKLWWSWYGEIHQGRNMPRLGVHCRTSSFKPSRSTRNQVDAMVKCHSTSSWFDSSSLLSFGMCHVIEEQSL